MLTQIQTASPAEAEKLRGVLDTLVEATNQNADVAEQANAKLTELFMIVFNRRPEELPADKDAFEALKAAVLILRSASAGILGLYRGVFGELPETGDPHAALLKLGVAVNALKRMARG